MFKTLILLLTLIAFIVLAGCPQVENENLDWSISEDRTTVFGILLDCSCSVADIEMLVTDENTGKDYVTNFTVDAGKRFVRPVEVTSDWLSVDLQITDMR